MILATTGHRPVDIALAVGRHRFDDVMGAELFAFARRKIGQSEATELIIGMALGWDTAAALACVKLGIPFRAYIPFEGQERLWGPRQQQLYRDLLGRASEVRVISSHTLNIAFNRRNEAMVDDCNKLLAFYSGKATGGTAHCVAYADQWTIPIDNLWPEWEARYED